MVSMDQRYAEATGQDKSPPQGFQLNWVWHNDEWCLARRDDRENGWIIFAPVAFGRMNVVQGPYAANVSGAPVGVPDAPATNFVYGMPLCEPENYSSGTNPRRFHSRRRREDEAFRERLLRYLDRVEQVLDSFGGKEK